jgi:exonuclease SbcC
MTIQNYQSHRSSGIEFTPGLNVIAGSTDNGKSSVIRAMLWALLNRPSGEAFKSWAADKDDSVDVTLNFDNGWVTKKREKSKNFYLTEGGKFEALRSDVPDPVQQICDITDYNIQTQLQPYFMLQQSSGERAKRLNELVGLDIIDRVFKKLNGKITRLKAELAHQNEQITKITNALVELEYLDDVAAQAAKLDTDIETVAELHQKQGTLSVLMLNVNEIDALIADHNETLKHESSYVALKEKVKALEELMQEKHTIGSFHGALLEVSMELDAWEPYLLAEPKYLELQDKIKEFTSKEKTKNQLSSIAVTLTKSMEDIKADKDWLQVEKPYIALHEKILQRDAIQTQHRLLRAAASSINVSDEEINTKTILLKGLIEKYVTLLKEVKVCPTCMSDIDASALGQVITKLEG